MPEKLDNTQIQKKLSTLDNGWSWDQEHQKINREFKFKNYYQTMAFVNAVAWIAHQQDHHPDMNVGYNRCLIEFSTHSAGGLTFLDFLCAKAIDDLSRN